MRNRLCQIALVFLAVIGSRCAGLAPKPYAEKAVPNIRVLLLQSDSVTIVPQGSYQLQDAQRFRSLLPKGRAVQFKITPARDGLQVFLEGREFFSTTTTIHLIAGGSAEGFKIQERRYRGNLHIALVSRSLQAVNVLNLESYLQGVVPVEIGKLGRRELQALMAQAVTARTYALKKIDLIQKRQPEQNYDVTADVADQVYLGETKRSRWSDWAVENTIGEVAVYNDTIIDAFYSSTCGGRTEFGKNVFAGADRPYLQGVADNFGSGDFCQDSPHYRWVESFLFEDLQRSLRMNLPDFAKTQNPESGIQGLWVTERFPSGRIRELAIQLQDRSKPLRLSGNDIRRAIRRDGNSLLRSNLLRVAEYGPQGKPIGVMLIGAGNGHGVGLCQWGAIGMARQGYSYQQILKHYFRGVTIKKIY